MNDKFSIKMKNKQSEGGSKAWRRL